RGDHGAERQKPRRQRAFHGRLDHPPPRRSRRRRARAADGAFQPRLHARARRHGPSRQLADRLRSRIRGADARHAERHPGKLHPLGADLNAGAAMTMTTRIDNARVIRAATGTELTAKSWLTEAPLRMLMNNLDPGVAEKPSEL